MNIKVLRLEHGYDLPVPHKMTEGASGCDLRAAVEKDIILKPGDIELIPTGFCYEIPVGYEVQVRPRSGLAAKHGVTVLNTPGTIDADYRGEVKVILINHSKEDFVISRGERIAQAVPAKVEVHMDFEEAEELSDTDRGAGGFGHTGR